MPAFCKFADDTGLFSSNSGCVNCSGGGGGNSLVPAATNWTGSVGGGDGEY